MSDPLKPTAVTIAKPAQTTFLGNLGHAIGQFFSHEVAPLLVGLWHMIQMDVIAKLAPVVHDELDKLDQALLSGGVEGFLKAFNALVPATLQRAETIAAGASVHDVITTIQGVLAQRMKS